MTEPTPPQIIDRAARLAYLDLTDAQVNRYADQLAQIIEHVSRLQEIDVTGVEPMAHPLEVVNRLDDDEARDALSPSVVLELAPNREGAFIAVPKTIDATGGGG